MIFLRKRIKSICMSKLLSFKTWKIQEENKAQELCREIALPGNRTLQYSDIGEGHPVLYIHGSLGGCDSGPMLFDALIKKGFRFISPSRPGYLKTPLDQGKTPVDQAKLYMELLAQLGVDKVSVIAHSGGSPSAISFVTEYPGRVHSLILYAPVSHRWARRLAFLERIFLHDASLWVLYVFSKFFPSITHRLLCGVLSISYQDVRDSPGAIAFLDWFIESLMPIQLRVPGLKNDLYQFSNLTKPAYNKIKCPVYLFHGAHDHEVPESFTTYVAKQLENEKFLLSEGGHEPTFLIKGERILDEMVTFLQTHADQTKNVKNI